MKRKVFVLKHGGSGETRMCVVRTLATSAFLKLCSRATAFQSMSALLRVCLTIAKKNMASWAVGSLFLGVVWPAMVVSKLR